MCYYATHKSDFRETRDTHTLSKESIFKLMNPVACSEPVEGLALSEVEQSLRGIPTESG